MNNLQEYIRQHAMRTPDKPAFVVGDQRVSYKQLAQALSAGRGDKQGSALPGLPGTLPIHRLFGDITLSTTGTTGKPKQVVYRALRPTPPLSSVGRSTTWAACRRYGP